MKITVMGMWHLGSVASACLSTKHDVCCYDDNPETIENLKKGIMPIYEPGLAELFERNKKKLTFSSNKIPNSDFIYIAYDTPIDSEGRPNLSVIKRAVKKIKGTKAKVLISSQLPVGTSSSISKQLNTPVCYMPENLRLGRAIEDFLKPERLVFGVPPSIEEDIQELFSFIECPKIVLSPEEAEMLKHTLNSYLAMMIVFTNEISDICEKHSIDATKVMDTLKTDKRVSKYAPLKPGLGFSGGTLLRDLWVLTHFRAPLFSEIARLNRHRDCYVLKKLMSIENIFSKSISFLGLTYKAGTDTTRHSPTLKVLNQIGGWKERVRVHDPKVKRLRGYEICTLDEAMKSEVIVIMVADERYKSLDYTGKIVIDTKNMLSHQKGIKLYKGVGMPDNCYYRG